MKKLIPFLLLMCFALLTSAQIVISPPYMTLKCAKSNVMAVSISPKGNVIGIGLSEYAELWDIDKEKKLFVLKHETPGGVKAACHISFSPNGEYVATVDFKGKRKVWSVKKGAEDKYLKNHIEWLPEPDFVKNTLGLKMANSGFDQFYTQKEADHPKDKDIVAKSTKTSTVEFHNTADGAIEQELTFPNTKNRLHLYPVYFDDYGDIFITGSDQGEVYFYKIAPKSRY